MAVTFIGAGAFANNATLASQSISSHASTAIGDILICQLINKSVTANAFSPPDGTWTAVIATEVNDCTTAADDHQYGLYWKRATAAGAQAFTFTKAVDDNVLFGGVISAWRGAKSTGSPLDATAAVRTETVGAADNVTFPAYDPTSTSVHVIFMAYYGNDATTFAAAMSGDTNPDCTTRYDLETATGNDASLACTSGDNDGSNVASRTWASAATTDAGNTGVVFALVAANDVTMTGAVGAFTLSGQAALFRKTLVSGAGAFSLSGQAAALRTATNLTGAAGAFTFTGQDADLFEEAAGAGVTADVGAFALAGQAALFRVNGAATTGAFAFTGQNATFFVTGPVTLSAGTGSFVLTGQDAGILGGAQGVPAITGWAGGHHLRRKRTKPIEEVLADIVAEPPGLPTPKERAALKRAARKARQQEDDDDAMELLLLALH